MDILIFTSLTTGERIALPVGKICAIKETPNGTDIHIDGNEHGVFFARESFDEVVDEIEAAYAAIRALRSKPQ